MGLACPTRATIDSMLQTLSANEFWWVGVQEKRLLCFGSCLLEHHQEKKTKLSPIVFMLPFCPTPAFNFLMINFKYNYEYCYNRFSSLMFLVFVFVTHSELPPDKLGGT